MSLHLWSRITAFSHEEINAPKCERRSESARYKWRNQSVRFHWRDRTWCRKKHRNERLPAASTRWDLLQTAVVKQQCIQSVKGCKCIPSTARESIKHPNLSVTAVVTGWWLVSHKLGWLRLQLGLGNTLKSCRVWSEQIKACVVLPHDFPSQTWPLSRSNAPLSFSDPPCAAASQISWKHDWFVSIRLFSEHPQIDSLRCVWMERYIFWCSK